MDINFILPTTVACSINCCYQVNIVLDSRHTKDTVYKYKAVVKNRQFKFPRRGALCIHHSQ